MNFLNTEAGDKMKRHGQQSDKPGPNHARAAYGLCMQPWTNRSTLATHL